MYKYWMLLRRNKTSHHQTISTALTTRSKSASIVPKFSSTNFTMYKSIIAIASMALVPMAAAVGSARVINNCDFEVTLWSVGGSISDPSTLASNGGSYSEQFVVDPSSGGKALKITRESDGLFTSKPQTDFAYSLSGDRIFYDLSDVFGDPFSGLQIKVAPTDTSCPSIVWGSGFSASFQSNVHDCSADADVSLTLCSS
jgi:hypothetical protein